MKKFVVALLAISILSVGALTGCKSKEEQENLDNAQQGNVAEAQGTEDVYGWTPHLRLTFEGDTITQTYFDYINSDAEKKSEDSTYIAGMKEKTGIGVDEAMAQLSEQLLQVQNPDQVDVVTGATTTSNEFKALAKAAYDSYKKGDNVNNPVIVDTTQKPASEAGGGQDTGVTNSES